MEDLDAACEEIAKGILDTEFCVEDVNTSRHLSNVDAALQSDVAGVRVPTEQQAPQQPASVLPEVVAEAGPISMTWVALNFADHAINRSENAVADSFRAAVKEEPPILARETAGPVNEFTSNRDLLGGAFPWIFMFGGEKAVANDGEKKKAANDGPLSVHTKDHLLHQFHNAPACDQQLVFFLANQTLRHSAIRAVASRVSARGDGVLKFVEKVNSDDFKKNMADARGGDAIAESRLAKDVAKYMMPLGASVPHSPTARRAAMSQLYAMVFAFGLPSVFWTIAPDDKNFALSVRMCCASTSNQEFPSQNVREFIEAFETGGSVPGYDSFEMKFDKFDTPSLLKLLNASPVAACDAFYELVFAVYKHLLRTPLQQHVKSSSTPSWSTTGIFGRAYATFGVTEVQGRGSLHLHALHWGTYSPTVLQRAFSDPHYREAMRAALASMFQAHVSPEVHFDRLLERAASAQRIGDPAAVISEARKSVPRVFDDLGNFTVEFKTRCEASVVRTCLHGHSSSCRKSDRDSCRFCMPKGETPDDINAATGRGLASVKELVVSASGGSDYAVRTEIQRINTDCTLQRNFKQHPLPSPDDRHLAVEIYRPRIDNYNMSEKQKHLFDQLPPISQQWIRTMLPFQNLLLSTVNGLAQGLFPGNQAAECTGSQVQAEAALFYMMKYMTKDGLDLRHAMTALLQADEHVKKRPSIAADAGTPKRDAMYLMQSMLQKSAAYMEISDSQAAAIAMGLPAELSSHSFATVSVSGALLYIQQQMDDGPGSDSECELDNEAPEFQPTADIYTTRDADEQAVVHVAVTQAENYNCRGKALADMTLYEYVALMVVKEKEVKKHNAERRGRPVVPGFRFVNHHPLFLTHGQVIGSRIRVPIPRGNPRKLPELNNDSNAESWRRKANHAAAYYLTLLRPWTVQELRQGRIQLTWKDFEDWIRQLQLGVDGSEEHPRPTLMDSYRFGLLVQMTSSFQSVPVEVRAMYNKHRFRNVPSWSQLKQGAVDGTQFPPTSVGGEMQLQWERRRLEEHEAQAAALDEAIEITTKMLPKKPGNAKPSNAVKYTEATRAVFQLLHDTADAKMCADSENGRSHSLEAAVTSSATVWVQPSFTPNAASVLKELQTAPPLAALTEEVREFSKPTSVCQDACRQADPDPQLPDFFRDLDPAQQSAIRPVVVFIDGIHSGTCGVPPRLLFHGGPGSGKTHTIQKLIQYAQLKGVRVACAAAFASAAVNMLNGETIHSLFAISIRSKNEFLTFITSKNQKDLPKATRLNDLRERLKDVDLLIIDEISCVAPDLLAKVSCRTQQIWQNFGVDFGGCGVILVGDMFQIPPVGNSSLAMATVEMQLDKKQRRRDPGQLCWDGCRLFQTFSLISFEGQQRAKNDHEWSAAINEARISGSITESMFKLLRPLTADDIVNDRLWRFPTIITRTVLEAVSLSYDQAKRWAKEHGAPVVIWMHTITNLPETDEEQQVLHCLKTDPRMLFVFVPGCPALLTENLKATRKGICNGTRVTLHSFSFTKTKKKGKRSSRSNQHADNLDDEIHKIQQEIARAKAGEIILIGVEPDIVNVRIVYPSGNAYRFKDAESLVPLADGVVIPIYRSSESSKFKVYIPELGRDFTVNYYDFPIMLAFAMTFHKSQGQTLDRVLVNLNDMPDIQPNLTFEMVYVSLTRVRQASHLRLMPQEDGKVALEHLRQLQVNRMTQAWLAGFGRADDGCLLPKWNAEMAKQKALELLAIAANNKKSKNKAKMKTSAAQSSAKKSAVSARAPAKGMAAPATESGSAVKFIGIHNELNTCYISSVLQTIFALPSFMKDLANVVVPPMEQHAFPGFQGSDVRQESVTHHLVSLYQDLEEKNRICYAKSLRLVLSQDAVEYNDDGKGQHDAQEFLACLLDAIERDFFRAAGKVMSSQPQQLSAELCSAVKECTPAMRHFACRINFEFTCETCRFQRSKSDCCNLVHLDLPPVDASRSIPLERLLDYYFKETLLRRNCDQKCPGKMRYIIFSLCTNCEWCQVPL